MRQGAWAFGEGTAAVLSIHEPTFVSLSFCLRKGEDRTTDRREVLQTILPGELDVDILVNSEALQGKYVVTSVTSCPAYASYLTAKGMPRIGPNVSCTLMPLIQATPPFRWRCAFKRPVALEQLAEAGG